MKELFRFGVIRPPRPASRRGSIVFPGNLTLLRRGLFAALDHPDPRASMRTAAAQFFEGSEFSEDAASIQFGSALLDLRERLQNPGSISGAMLASAVEEVTGAVANQLVEDVGFVNLKDRAFDTVLALRVLPDRFPRLSPLFAGLVRMIDLIQRLSENDQTLDDETAATLLRRTIVLPRALFPMPRTPYPAPTPASAGDLRAGGRGGGGEARQLSNRIAALDRARVAILSTGADDLAITGGRDARVRSNAIARLPADVRDALRSVNVNLSNMTVSAALEQIRLASAVLGQSLREIQEQRIAPSLVMIGTATVPMLDQNLLPAGDIALPEGPRVPTSVGAIRPIGIMPLIVVFEQIKRYELDQISDVQTILRSEKQSRETRRLTRTEESFETEIERSTEQERDEQTTERNEMQQEVGRTIEESERFNVGATISGSYGPIKAELTTGFESEFATEESRKSASTYAREVTNKTATKVTEKVREKRTRTTLEEFEEKFGHGFDNTAGAADVSAIFQWLTKVMEYEVREVGERLMIEVMAPEPAANYLWSVARESELPDGFAPPEPFTAAPGDITPENYGEFVKKYNVSGVEPVPDFITTISIALEGTAQALEEGALPPPMAEAKDVDIPKGYRGFIAHVSSNVIAVPPEPVSGTPGGFGPAAEVYITVGQQEFSSESESRILNGETGDSPQNIPVTVLVNNVLAYTVAIEIRCIQMPGTMEAWRLKMHALILQAYLALKAEHQERLAALALERREGPEGRHPLENQSIIRSELQRSAISILTAQHYDLFSAILESAAQRPRIDFDEAFAEGNYVAAFSRWFEWENMVYVFQPYFWARKSTWNYRLLSTDIDPLFAAFLRAGFVRIQIPVRPGFEEFALAFFETGEVPQSHPSGVIGEDYLSIMEELKAMLGVGDRGELIDSFEVRLPTTLHMLRTSPSLPAWERNEEGNWIPVETAP